MVNHTNNNYSINQKKRTNDVKLTDSYILLNPKSEDLKLNLSLSHLKNFQQKPYLLIIQSIIENCTRITIYPLDKKSIIKIILNGSDISDEIISDLSQLLQNYEIIHTSGLLIKGRDLFYECYLNQELDSPKTKDLKTSLDKIRNIFKEVRIEQIELKQTKS